MKKLLLILLCFPMIGFGQNVNIPDANFKAYLVGNTSINTNGDSEIQQSEAAAFNGQIICSFMNISDLTGIEYFTDLVHLDCHFNLLTSLDMSSNPDLDFLYCSHNQITSIDVSQNTILDELVCFNNQLISLDLSNNTALADMACFNNPNLSCIKVDDPVWSATNWEPLDPQHYFSNNCSGTSVEEHTTNKEFLKVTDLLGRETKQKNQPIFYIYDDGTAEKRIVIE